MSPFKKLIFVLVLTILALYVSVFSPKLDINVGKFSIKKSFDMILGLDLAGGSHLVFEADLSKIPGDKKKASLESLRNIIERRVNLFGISEPDVRQSNFEGKERIVVELPGVHDTKEAVNLIGKTAQLEFAELEELKVDKNATPSSTLKPTNLSGADLQSSSVTFDRNTGKPSISLQFTKEGGDKFAEISGRNVGKSLPILLDGEIISAPTVQEKIIGGSAIISGNFTLDEAKKLSIQLNAGALPVSVKLIEERTVGATLGKESVEKSVRAGLVGLAMVLIFMVLSYGKLGIVADVGLLIFGSITLALYKLIPITLTLPGIAGFMLSIGMAVDSNILIFERFKEEKLLRPVADALEVSFGRAWDSIRDANVATIITSLILMNPMDWSNLPTSGPVRGFAITLLMGILISLFTGIFVSRNLLRVFVKEK